MAPSSITDAGVLGENWKSSSDRAVTTSGDSTGFHVLVADASAGYQWRTAASLSEPGFEADSWIGNICVTGSGDRAVVVYAPRTFTNKPDLADRGGFTAVVDLVAGTVRKLPVQTSLAYFNPGCGAGESAVLTQGGGEDLPSTRLLELDTAAAALGTPIEVPGQLTSPVPTPHGIVAADSGALVRVAQDGKRTFLASAKGVPYRVTPDADGGVVFLQREGKEGAAAVRTDVPATGHGTVTTLATGGLTDVGVHAGRGGQVFVSGDLTRKVRSTPASVAIADIPDTATPSLSGELAVTKVLRTNGPDPRVATGDPYQPQQVDITAVSLETGKEFTLSTVPAAGAGGGSAPSPALPSAPPGVANSPTDPSDGNQRWCSVPRNDTRMQVMQPKPRQVEWAVNQAIRGVLNVQRPTNWQNLGMPAYTPQGMFPRGGLDGGGYIPAQVMLGVLAQESNLWQAARYAIPGMTANPLIGNFYGIDYYNGSEGDDWSIRWDEADCGYGVGQVTDGMRLAGKEKPGETSLPWNQQRAIGLDFAANVAKSVQMLQQKWNQTKAAGLVINNGDSAKPENWFLAVWAYNSGFYPQSSAGQYNGAWGVGWLNNPVNPRYPANRTPFLDDTYADAAHPQHWPYPEKVMGWAGHPIELLEAPNTFVHGYRPAWWATDQDRRNVKPPVTQFCDATNQCIPGVEILPTDPEMIGEKAGPCAHKNAAGQYDLRCYFHTSSTWKVDCEVTCGNELLRFDPGYPYQDDGNSHPPNCGFGGLPAGALIVDNRPTSEPSYRPNCPKAFSNAGSFHFSFPADGAGNYPGKIDVHQIGTGFGGHFWMSNTHNDFARRAIGTWTLDRGVGSWARVFVHLPVVGARTHQAMYEIDVDGNGTYRKKRYLPQEIRQNGWVSLGSFNFKGVPSVRLVNTAADGPSSDRIAWDAIAVQPLAGKPRHMIAALGDSYSSGEGAGNYITQSDLNHGTPQWNACRRSRDAWSRKVVLPGASESLGTLVDRFDQNHELGFVACSGARTWNAGGWAYPDSWVQPEKYELGEGQFHEISQLESGVLDEHTTLVTLTIGGNDGGGFSNVLMECASPGRNCVSDSSFIPRYESMLNQSSTNITVLLREIHAAAPNADIVLMGYPRMFSAGGCATVVESEAAAVNQLADYFAGKQAQLASSLRNQGYPVHHANPIPDFVGHGGCDDSAWINDLRVGPYGEGDFHAGDRAGIFCIPKEIGGLCLSRESFHPNGSGTSAYANVLRRKLDEIGYVG